PASATSLVLRSAAPGGKARPRRRRRRRAELGPIASADQVRSSVLPAALRVHCLTLAGGFGTLAYLQPQHGRWAMTTSELVQKLAEANSDLYQRDVETIVTAIFDEIAAALARGDRVELRGFGAFSVKRRDARIGRNPRTGDSVSVAEKHIPFFKTGKQLRDRLNQSARRL